MPSIPRTQLLFEAIRKLIGTCVKLRQKDNLLPPLIHMRFSGGESATSPIRRIGRSPT